MKEFEGCTAEERERVAQFIPAVVISEFISDNSTVADSKIVSYTYRIIIILLTPYQCDIAEWSSAQKLSLKLKKMAFP